MKKLRKFFKVILQLLVSQRPHQNPFQQHNDFQFSSQSLAVPSSYAGSIRKLFAKSNEFLVTLKEDAIQMGLYSKGDSPFPPSEPVESVAALIDTSSVEILSSMENHESKLKQELAPVVQRLEKPIEDKVRELDQMRRDELNEQKEKHLEDDKNDTTVLEEEIISTERDYNFYEGQRLIALKRIGRVPVKGSLDKIIPVAIVTSVILVIEINIIKYAFDALLFSSNVGVMIAIVLSLMLAYGASRIGDGYAHLNKFDFRSGMALCLSSIAAISYIRFFGTARLAARNATHKAIESGVELGIAVDVDHTIDIFMLGLNLVFPATAFILEAKRHLRAAYFDAEKKRDEALDRKKEAQKLLNIKRLAAPQKEKRIEESYQSKILVQAHTEHDRDISMKVELESGISAISDVRKRFERDLGIIKEYATKTFNEHFQVGVANRRPSINGLFTNAAFILSIGTLFFSAGCGAVENMITGKPEHIEIWLVRDSTIEPIYQNEVNISKLNTFLVDEVMELRSEEAPRTKVDFYTCVLGDLAISTHKLAVSLEEGEPKSDRVLFNRVDSINVFLDRLRKVTKNLFVNGGGMDKSEVNQCLCRGLKKLSQSTASKKYFIVNSDFRENAKISFHMMEPGEIADSRYEEIAASFSKACPLEDISGINVIGFYTPPRQIQDNVLDAQAFWKRYLESHGAKVSFIPNF